MLLIILDSSVSFRASGWMARYNAKIDRVPLRFRTEALAQAAAHKLNAEAK